MSTVANSLVEAREDSIIKPTEPGLLQTLKGLTEEVEQENSRLRYLLHEVLKSTKLTRGKLA